VWRILREFEKRGLPLTVFGVSMALQRHPELTAAFVELGHEIACHGWRWITTRTSTKPPSAPTCMRRWTSSSADRQRPLGWYTGRDSPNTRRLVADYGGFAYDSDYYGDDLPFWMKVRRPMAAWCPSSSCPTRWTATTCALRCPRAFARRPVLQYLKDTLTRCTPRATPLATTRPR
jgi:allantoinase